MKRSYDYSFATDGRDYTYATTTHSFTLRHPYARATQAAPSYTYSVQACSTNIASGSSSGTGLPFVDFRRPLLSATSGSHDDFQSNAATPNAAVPPEADGYFAFRPEPGSTGLGIQCDGLAAQHARPTVKHEAFTLDSLGQLYSPLPGGLLELLTEPHAAPTGGNEVGPSCTQPAKDILLTREDAQDDVITLEDSLGFFPGSATPSLLYPSSPALGTGAFWGDVPLFYSSGSESSVEDTLVNTSLFYPSSAEVSATSSPVKAALFLSSSSLASVQDSHAASSGCVRDPLRALLDFDSPLLGLGQDVFVKQQEPVVGLYADVNLRRIPTAHDAPEVYINPAELTSGHGLAVKTEEEQDVAELSGRTDVVAPEQDKLPTTDSGAITGFTDEAVQAIVGVITGANHGGIQASLPKPP
ncbi:hypothetical protein EVJ58_g5066 [Rhodofomes roseus]|uniref:Uncharacterized protein n=1 Tax=Rhodofomes roseus TaxID=34475 RepID=A0A4Y9YEF5_9APHY|nr:hypothetical protein EVJ58_g5066 [Rhodofomes roseus]